MGKALDRFREQENKVNKIRKEEEPRNTGAPSNDMQTVADKKPETMTRKDFLKKGLFGALGVILVSKSAVTTASAATVTDNLGGGGGGVHIGTSAPSNKGKLWIDTSASGRGVAKYWNGSAWSATASVWDD